MISNRLKNILLAVLVVAGVLLLGPYFGLRFFSHEPHQRSEPEQRTIESKDRVVAPHKSQDLEEIEKLLSK